VTTKLIDIASDSAVWAHKYSGTNEDVFTIQESISRGIVDALHLVLSPRESERLVARPLDDIRAYESYLKAKREMLTFTKEGLDRALAFLESSERLVGENILLLSATGHVYWQYVNAGIDNNPVYLEKARAAAERILTLAPESEHGHRLLGLVQVHEGNVREGIRSLKRALEIDPNDPDTLVWLCVFCGNTGKSAAARPWAERLKLIDPLTPLFQVIPAMLAAMEGRFKEAIEAFAPQYAGNLDNPGVRLMYGQTLPCRSSTRSSATCRTARSRSWRGSTRARSGATARPPGPASLQRCRRSWAAIRSTRGFSRSVTRSSMTGTARSSGSIAPRRAASSTTRCWPNATRCSSRFEASPRSRS
jgi:tetratricopeptide (TPR) repeat protein